MHGRNQSVVRVHLSLMQKNGNAGRSDRYNGRAHRTSVVRGRSIAQHVLVSRHQALIR